MYHVSARGVDERMINVHYYYYVQTSVRNFVGLSTNLNYLSVCNNKGHILGGGWVRGWVVH